MHTISFVLATEPIRKILNSMGYPADSPRIYPARRDRGEVRYEDAA